jgi:hypothetical protein
MTHRFTGSAIARRANPALVLGLLVAVAAVGFARAELVRAIGISFQIMPDRPYHQEFSDPSPMIYCG